MMKRNILGELIAGVVLGVVIFYCLVQLGMDAIKRCEEPLLEERRLVFDCMLEIGWEVSDEETDARTQLEQSREWCEAFVRGAQTR